jgi:citrate synthase
MAECKPGAGGPVAGRAACLPCGASRVIDGEIFARGVPIGRLVADVSFVDMLFFQLQARYPVGPEARMMEAYLVALCEHGVTSPSTHGARVAASVRTPLAGSAISFIAGAMGPYHFGALEQAMAELRAVVAGGADPAEHVDRRLASGVRIWGFGHRFHKSSDGTGADASTIERFQEQADPRVRALTALADELGWDGPHTRAARAIGHALYERKKIPINIDGIGAGLLLDMGFEPACAMLFVILGRLPNIARLHLEEQDQTPNRFVALATNEDPGFRRTTDRDLPV